MFNPPDEFHLHEQNFALGLALKRRLGVTRKKARLPDDVWEKKPAFLPLDTLLREERSLGARKRSKSTKPTVKCCSYTLSCLFSRYVQALINQASVQTWSSNLSIIRTLYRAGDFAILTPTAALTTLLGAALPDVALFVLTQVSFSRIIA